MHFVYYGRQGCLFTPYSFTHIGVARRAKGAVPPPPIRLYIMFKNFFSKKLVLLCFVPPKSKFLATPMCTLRGYYYNSVSSEIGVFMGIVFNFTLLIVSKIIL